MMAPVMQNNGQQRLEGAISPFKREMLHEWTISLNGQLWHGIENSPFLW